MDLNSLINFLKLQQFLPMQGMPASTVPSLSNPFVLDTLKLLKAQQLQARFLQSPLPENMLTSLLSIPPSMLSACNSGREVHPSLSNMFNVSVLSNATGNEVDAMSLLRKRRHTEMSRSPGASAQVNSSNTSNDVEPLIEQGSHLSKRARKADQEKKRREALSTVFVDLRAILNTLYENKLDREINRTELLIVLITTLSSYLDLPIPSEDRQREIIGTTYTQVRERLESEQCNLGERLTEANQVGKSKLSVEMMKELKREKEKKRRRNFKVMTSIIGIMLGAVSSDNKILVLQTACKLVEQNMRASRKMYAS